jgi:hypothetical protein
VCAEAKSRSSEAGLAAVGIVRETADDGFPLGLSILLTKAALNLLF